MRNVSIYNETAKYLKKLADERNKEVAEVLREIIDSYKIEEDLRKAMDAIKNQEDCLRRDVL